MPIYLEVHLSFPSSRVSNTGEDRDLYKRMFGLEESMKLIMVAFKIGEVDSTETAKENIRTLDGAINGKNPSIKIAHTDTHNECLKHEFKENEVIVGILIVERV